MYGNKRIHAAPALMGVLAAMTASMVACTMEDPAMVEATVDPALRQEEAAAQQSMPAARAQDTLSSYCGDGYCDYYYETCWSCWEDCGDCYPCSHDPCETGDPLNPNCDDCVASVCEADPYCCDTEWDITCVDEVYDVCGYDCYPCLLDECSDRGGSLRSESLGGAVPAALAPSPLALTPLASDDALIAVADAFSVFARHSGKALDVSGASTADGAQLIQWDYHGGDNQRSRFESVGEGYYRIMAKHSGKVLDVS